MSQTSHRAGVTLPEPMLYVALIEPEVHPNTGNIARLWTAEPGGAALGWAARVPH